MNYYINNRIVGFQEFHIVLCDCIVLSTNQYNFGTKYNECLETTLNDLLNRIKNNCEIVCVANKTFKVSSERSREILKVSDKTIYSNKCGMNLPQWIYTRVGYYKLDKYNSVYESEVYDNERIDVEDIVKRLNK